MVLPRLVVFAGPEPQDYADYVKTGLYPLRETTPQVPFIYGKRWKQWHGGVWKSVDAWVAGDPQVDTLEAKHSYSFVAAVETTNGRVFVRPNGSVVPESALYVFPIPTFAGRDLAARPLPDGTSAAWAYGSGVRLRAGPSKTGTVLAILPPQAELSVRPSPDAAWWEVTGDSAGYVSASLLRVWSSAPRPPDVGAAEIWVDVDLAQQALALMRGDVPIFITLLSSGVLDHDSPDGTYRITDKATIGDMNSLAGADEAYEVDDVPWVIHFKPRYAVHTAYWHWGFGQTASHGCINLSPRDAHYLFDRIHPLMPGGWSKVDASAEDPGTVLRIRGTTP